MLAIVTNALKSCDDIEVVGMARSSQEAREVIRSTNPDIVTLDVEMPGMNGLDFLRKIMELRPMPVIMVSTLTAAGTDVTLTALELGAVDAIAKPSGQNGIERFAESLRTKVRNGARARVQSVTSRPQAPVAVHPPTGLNIARTPALQMGPIPDQPRTAWARQLLAIGASTGGVSALTQLLAQLPPTTPPVVITQHMPPEFTARFAARLDAQLAHSVSEAQDGEELRPGLIRIAPGTQHLKIERRGGILTTRLDGSPPVSGHRPSVDVMFASIAQTSAPSAVAVILTGMGRDGAEGMKAMRNAGSDCLGQSERSCVVYGMPKAAKECGAVTEELDLNDLPARIISALRAPVARKAS
jgi:two-component system chemotaxis response regulator CheB